MIAADGVAMEVELEGPGTFAVDVVGVSRRQDVLERAVAEQGAIVEANLILEDENPHDSEAVAVQIGGELVGYLSREKARLYRADLAAAGAPRVTVRCKAKIVGGFETARGERAHFGLRLDLPPLDA
jgi:hypothetical protein